MQWYNPTAANGGARERDFDPTLTNAEGGGIERTVLEVSLLTDTTGAFIPSAWAGLTHSISRWGEDLSLTRAVEMWINDRTQDHSQTHARVHLDFGRMSEDAFWQTDSLPNNRLDSEDRNCDTKLDYGEDTGLDGVFDQDEPGYTGPGSDPRGDDFGYSNDPAKASDYSKINGTEGNAGIDTEDLDLNCNLDLVNSYFEATVDLSDTAYVAVDVARDYPGNSYVGPDNGWRLFRIPVAAFMAYGTPDWSSIRHERVWIDGMTGPTRIQIGGIQLIPIPASELPSRAQIRASRPNPFKSETVIQFDLASSGPVRLAIYDIKGRLAKELLKGYLPAGTHTATWSLLGNTGLTIPSGVYFCRLEAGGSVSTRRIVLVR